jgi:hypothetical protein
MSPLYEEKKVKRKTGVRKVQKSKGLFSADIIEVEEPIYETLTENVPTGERSDTYIDIGDFSRRIAEACNGLHENGYDVIKITEVIDGRYHWGNYCGSSNGNAATCYSYGYSVTDGVIIIGKKRETSGVA